MFFLPPETTRCGHFRCIELGVGLDPLVEFSVQVIHDAILGYFQLFVSGAAHVYLVNSHDKRSESDNETCQYAGTEQCIGYPVKPCGDPLHALIMASPPVRRHGFGYNMYINPQK